MHRTTKFPNKLKLEREHVTTRNTDLVEKLGIELQEKTSAAAAPRKPKNGAVSSPLKEAIITATKSNRSDLRSEILRFPHREVPRSDLCYRTV